MLAGCCSQGQDAGFGTALAVRGVPGASTVMFALVAAMPSVLVYDAEYFQLQVALETKKPRQMRQPSKAESAEPPLATAAGVAEPAAAAATFLQQPMKEPQAQGLAMEPYQRSSPAVSPWSSPYRTPQGVSPADTPLIASAGHTPLVSSPVSSENTFTLLPGYVSRPGPSPLKPPRRSSPSREPGADTNLCARWPYPGPDDCMRGQLLEMQSYSTCGAWIACRTRCPHVSPVLTGWQIVQEGF